jgi:uncharacterized FAD-dependent dehydrogenase
MQKELVLKLLPSEAANEETIRQYIASSAATKQANITGYHIKKKSIDARGKVVFINLQLTAFINEPFVARPTSVVNFKDVSSASKKVIIVGAGPAGLFAALQLIEAGIQPIIIERGKDVRARRRDLAQLNKEGTVNPESNYCFGEGGAGTYSDGKLYTRSNKRGNINRILQLFVQFGAPENILFDAHPHIGTNKLPQIITAMREQIIACGGKVLFDKKLTRIQHNGGDITAIYTADGEEMRADAYILATGHSARDIFVMLQQEKIAIEAKPFALGVRVEHPQQLIDNVQYHCDSRDPYLPPASYSLVQQVNERGVFSFCMCPGGIIAPASTAPGELVVNGWSPSKRNNPFANSGMVVQIDEAAAYEVLRKGTHRNIDPTDPLLMMYFQQMVEQKAFEMGGGNMMAPAQRMTQFIERTTSSTLPANSYLPGLQPTALDTVLPYFVYDTLAAGFKAFGKKMKGYLSNEAVVVATESRTSSPVRIPRNPETLAHPQLSNLYPCAEGAGYAGGIVSAAMDGERIALFLQKKWMLL